MGEGAKVSFGVRKTRVHKKRFGPKCRKPKPYNRQGR